MRLIPAVILACSFAPSAHAQKLQRIPPPAVPVSLATLRDSYRPLLIFTPTTSDPRLLKQLHTLVDNDKACASRQIMPLLFNQKQGGVRWAELLNAYSVRQRDIADPDGVRAAYHIGPNDFTVILLGKDGGEKLRAQHPIALTQLLSTIDAMPMRQQEMKAK